ncbi:MAG: glycosyltransferase family 2 protein [Bacilli bacterium]
MMTNKVSVIIPTYNRKAMVRELLHALQQQTVAPYEIIIVNDAGEAIPELKSEFSSLPITILNHKVNQLHVAARRTGLSIATGTWIMFIDDDDLIVPQHIECMLNHAQGELFLHADAELFTYEWKQGIRIPTSRFLFSYHTTPEYMRTFSTFIPSGSLINRHYLEQLGGLDVSMKHYWDWDLYLRAMAHKLPKRVPIASVLYAYHGTTGNQSSNVDSMRVHLDRLIKKHDLANLPTANFFHLLESSEMRSRIAESTQLWNGEVFWQEKATK